MPEAECVVELTGKAWEPVPAATMVCGIDPGLDGAILLYNFETNLHETLRLSDYLAIEHGSWELSQDLRMVKDYIGLCVMEDLPTAHPGQRGINSSKTMGMNWGLIRGILIAHEIPTITQLPQVWQPLVFGARKDREGEDLAPKIASVKFAKTFLPTLNLRPGKMRTDHDGIADAACLAWLAAKKYKEGIRGQ